MNGNRAGSRAACRETSAGVLSEGSGAVDRTNVKWIARSGTFSPTILRFLNAPVVAAIEASVFCCLRRPPFQHRLYGREPARCPAPPAGGLSHAGWAGRAALWATTSLPPARSMGQ
ncbi:hypothetical protein GCM10014715_46000 [Streptomyces spiralis]|uniref:Uncharacterized protein n=1 Tax=Streptomyces spiralis TaxID=66376 RepID=A0A919A3J5_9ACTN|nr:hypothetical protein GCM10014715_46000 [Streptomyces spiralis]